MKIATKNLALAAMFFALGIVLPFFTGQIPQIGSMLLPMHFPVLVCGVVCGWRYGAVVGFTLPIVRFFLFGMPPLFPVGIAMAFEMALYGLVIGLLYQMLPKKIGFTYGSLLGAMCAGRIAWGVVMFIALGVTSNAFTWQAFLGGAVLSAIPGIVLQLVLIPVLLAVLRRVGAIPNEQPSTTSAAA